MKVDSTSFLSLLEIGLADRHLSDTERRALTEQLSDAVPLEESLRRVRNRAFEIARSQAANGIEATLVLKWLEGVMRAIDGAREPAESIRFATGFSPGEDCLRLILQQLRAARSTVDVCVFTLSDDRISEELLAIHRRGVHLRVITDNEKEFDAGSDVEKLRRAGVSLAVDRTPAHMHHKFAIIDKHTLLNGSYNWTLSAARYNEENLVLCNAPILVAAFTAQFDKMWQALFEPTEPNRQRR